MVRCLHFVTVICQLALLRCCVANSVDQPNSSHVFQATYQYPLGVDSTVFNLPTDSGGNGSVALRPTQIKGRIYIPESASRSSKAPAIVLLAGKHADCRTFVDVPDYGPFPLDNFAVDDYGNCPQNTSIVESYRGFDYLGQTLAAEGYIVLSVGPLMLNNALGLGDDLWLNRARARLLLRTLEKLEIWNSDAKQSLKAIGRDLSGTIDVSQVGLLGHSRGGAAVRIAASMLMTPRNLNFKELVDWPKTLKSRISAVWEVAPFDSPKSGNMVTVKGIPWGLMAAGCEDDEVDFGFMIVNRGKTTRQITLSRPTVPGLTFSHSEWKTTFNLCLGDQNPIYNPTTPTVQYPLGNNRSINLPLAQSSESQQRVLQWAACRFFKAHVGVNADIRYSRALLSRIRYNNLSVEGIDLALANPNLASSTILQPFDDTTGVMVKPENDLYVKSLSEHAKLQFPHFKQETEKYGLPSNLIFTPVMKPLDLVTDAVYDKAVVVRLPASNRTSIYVPFITPILGHSGRKCEVQIDVARRDPCLLRSTDSHSTPANFCAQQKQVLITAHSTKWTNDDLSMSIKSRFSLEFAPYDLATQEVQAHRMTLLRVAWQTLSVPCYHIGTSNGLYLTITITGGDFAKGNETFLYIGPIRQVF